MGGALVQSELLLFFREFAQKAAIELKLPGTHQPTCIFHVCLIGKYPLLVTAIQQKGNPSLCWLSSRYLCTKVVDEPPTNQNMCTNKGKVSGAKNITYTVCC